MLVVLVAFSIVAVPEATNSCHDWISCDVCTQSTGWWGPSCRWCPDDGQCHAPGSTFNPCSSSKEITDLDKCTDPAPKPPSPGPNDKGTEFVQAVLDEIFKILKITGVDTSACASDFAGATVLLQDFATDIRSKSYASAVADLSRGLSAFSRSTLDCGVPELRQKLNALAASTRWANITSSSFHGVQVLVGASDLWNDFQALASAIDKQDPSAVGQKLGALLDDWSAVGKGCGDDKGCKLIDGLLRVLQVSAGEVRPCKAALTPAVANFTAAALAFEQKDYKASVAAFATGLDAVAMATSSDSCGLKAVADKIGNLGGKLRDAVVKVESSDIPQIIVGSADVYIELYATAADLQRGDYAGAGMQMVALLSALAASVCKTNVCIVFEGLLSSLQVGFKNLEGCTYALDNTWVTIESFLKALKNKQWHDVLPTLGDFLRLLSVSMGDCGVKQIGDVLQAAANKLHHDAFATEIGEVVQFLAHGSDISMDLGMVIKDYESGSWAALGRDLGGLSDWVTSSNCNAFVCRLVEGMLGEAELALTDLKPCEGKLRQAERSFSAGAAMWGQGHVLNAVKSWAAGLNGIAQGVGDCGLSDQLGYIEQEANVLGLGNLTVLNEAQVLLVHGSDFYQEFYGAMQDIMSHDHRSVGSKLAKVMADLNKWTAGHLCNSPVCYVLSGAMQYFADLEGDIGKCEADLSGAWTDFGNAFAKLSGLQRSFFAFERSEQNITEAIHELGEGLKLVANGVGDCHLAELADIIAKLSAKLGGVPVLSWIDDFLKILIDGVEIEKDVANACIDFSEHNWPGFGYNLIKLVTVLFASLDTRDVYV